MGTPGRRAFSLAPPPSGPSCFGPACARSAPPLSRFPLPPYRPRLFPQSLASSHLLGFPLTSPRSGPAPQGSLTGWKEEAAVARTPLTAPSSSSSAARAPPCKARPVYYRVTNPHATSAPFGQSLPSSFPYVAAFSSNDVSVVQSPAFLWNVRINQWKRVALTMTDIIPKSNRLRGLRD